MLRRDELQFDTDFYGNWNGQISALIRGYLETRRFYGYTKEEAARSFLREFNQKAVN